MSKTLPKHNKDKRISAEQTIILIRLIKKYRSLWDRGNPDFRSHNVNDPIYEKIGKYFQLTAEDVIQKFRRMRNCYRQEVRSIRNGQKQYSSLFYFDEMEFLKEQIVQRLEKRSPSSASSISSIKEEDYAEEIPMDSFEEMYSIEAADIETSNNEVDLISESRIDQIEMASDGEEHSRSRAEENSIVSEAKTDEFDVFADYVSSQLREMDKLSALETMQELQQIISNRRINILKNNLKRKQQPASTVVKFLYSLKKTKANQNADGGE